MSDKSKNLLCKCGHCFPGPPGTCCEGIEIKMPSSRLDECDKIPISEATKPYTGAKVWTDNYWIVIENCVLFYKNFSPQSDANLQSAEKLRDTYFPGAEIRKIPLIYGKNFPNLHDRFSFFGEEDFLEFEKIIDKFSNRPDLHAFILLDKLFPDDVDIICHSGHKEIQLSIKEEQIEKLTDEQILELVRCGVRYDGCLRMFT